MRMYLAGGMSGEDWRREVKKFMAVTGTDTWDMSKKKHTEITLVDPRDHGLTTPDLFTALDLEMVNHSDMVLAYMTSENPGGLALGVEIGYALAQHKVVIYVDKMDDDDPRYNSNTFLRSAATYHANSLEEAVNIAKILRNLREV